ncbi:MAG: hypothetical protein IRY95_08450, partial [Clostridia bacterium]|nr:hypothetical protein [Clostridia bacterium]
MPVEFRRTALRHRYLDPRRGFAPTEVEAEVREDPLTGETCRVILLKGFRVARPPDADARVASLRATLTSCPFCPGVLENRTPRFEPDLFPEGRLRRAEAVAFPNLMPFDAYACVVVLSADHFVTPSQLGPARIRDGLVLAVTFLRRVLVRRGDQVGGGF